MVSFSWSCFYKTRPVILALLSLGEAVFLYYRFVQFAEVPMSTDTDGSTHSTFNMSDPATIGFILDAISSITAVITTFFLFLMLFGAIMCCYVFCCIRRTESCSNILKRDGFKAFQRFVSLNCNCPCYRARPNLRFRLRFLFLLVCLLLRSVAIYLFWSVSGDSEQNLNKFYACLGSLVFLIATILLDIHHYTVWWCYTPAIDTTYFGRSRKHKRYIPYHIAGNTHHKDILGDRPCTSDPCYNRHLSHVVVFHGKNYKPQPRWNMLGAHDTDGTYIGFHTTTPKAAVAIVHSEFQPSTKGMLGKGVYFARSIEDTGGKATTEGGACIIAKVRMGKVFEFDKQAVYPYPKNLSYDKNLRRFINSSRWHEEYDTCYVNHPRENRDEFCIKDPEKQIIKWVVVIDRDPKVDDYGLDTEFDSTKCYCI